MFVRRHDVVDKRDNMNACTNRRGNNDRSFDDSRPVARKELIAGLTIVSATIAWIVVIMRFMIMVIVSLVGTAVLTVNVRID